MKEYSSLILRIGLSFVFLWFGFSQIFVPENFFGYLPSWLTVTDPVPFLIANGVFEVICGLLLLVGLFTRIVAVVLALRMILIIVSLGYNDVAVRDVGLLFSLIALALSTSLPWSFDKKLF